MIVALALIGAGVVGLRSRARAARADACVDGTACVPDPSPGGVERSTRNVVQASDFCRDVGYLCAELAEADSVLLRRWSHHDGTLVVHVPLPKSEESSFARELQRAAAQGLRAWNNQPFPILVDLRGDRNPDFAVRWTPSLGGSQLGITRTAWSPLDGIEVLAIELATRTPFSPGTPAGTRQIRLTAAHEMGHALGLPHSDQSRDVMYPTNTATAMSAQDYRSIEVLYETPDGTVIRRD